MPRDARQIEDGVRTALRSDRRIRNPDLIAVSADAIGTVVLRGAVENPPERRAAMYHARGVCGVLGVIDHLKLHPPLSGRLGDDAIRAAALEKLSADSHA